MIHATIFGNKRLWWMIFVMISLFFVSYATAQDKVVVIPLFFDSGPSTVTSATGRIWMDRNLGALRVATKSADPDAYGSLYQWGRLTDGHEYRASGTTSITTPDNVPGHGDFITKNDFPYDWRVPQEDSLWQVASGINNPCPDGFRLPTRTEWQNEALSWGSQDTAGAFASPLRLVVAGSRSRLSGGTIHNSGVVGWYWSSTINDISASLLTFGSGSASLFALHRAYGLSVRCIKD